ncbi:hypothetical protein CAMGR0001_0581 [Campylobacter gracilis RM3268]|uniref:Uncharacterized protein n=1 Tax=Campylobacter gracilis RM3268 TaxID=553220 RepID=C8PHY5_9BACT|nr:hypothetical protein CAMGR0001_0581 [Campylobacter gracilis RM3268]
MCIVTKFKPRAIVFEKQASVSAAYSAFKNGMKFTARRANLAAICKFKRRNLNHLPCAARG